MEGAGHKRSKSATCIEFEGIEEIEKQIQKQKAISELSSASHVDGATRRDGCMLELENGFSRLLEEVELKRRSPIDVPILTSRDRLLIPRGVLSQRSRSLDSYGPRNPWSSIQHSVDLLNSRLRMKKLESKDQYEDLETSHVTDKHYWSMEGSTSRLTQSEKANCQQKSMGAQGVSKNAKLQGSEQLDETQEMLDPDMDSKLKLLQKLNALCREHLDHLEVCPPSSPGSIALLKPSNSAKYEANADDEKREDGLLLRSHGRPTTRISYKSETHSGENDEKLTLPTKIVILKPNPKLKLEKMHSAGGKDSPNNMGFLKPSPREARPIARGSTRNIRHGWDGRSDLISRVRAYARDESSRDADDNDAGNGWYALSRNSYCRNNLSEHSSSGLLQSSSVSREAKKKLSESWKTNKKLSESRKMTHRDQVMEMVAEARTLRQKLSIPVREAKNEHVNVTVDFNGECDKLAGNSGTAIWDDGPSRVSSRSGCKDKLMQSSSRSKSLHSSSGSGIIDKKIATCDAIAEEDEYLMHWDGVTDGGSKTMKGNQYRNKESSLTDLKSRTKKPHSYHNALTGEADSSLEANSKIQRETNLEKDQSEKQTMSQAATEKCTNTSPASSMSSELSVKESCSQEPELGPCKGGSDSFCAASVLEVPCTEQVSPVSECFASLDVELHDLLMKLQLLKVESQGIEAPTLTSSENETLHQSDTVFEESSMLEAEDWKVSYILDVLTESGFEHYDLYKFRATWYCSECPLHTGVFYLQEENYKNNWITGTKDERRLLFDRISSALLKAFHLHVDLYPWVMPKLERVDLAHQKQVVRDACEKLSSGDDFEAEAEVPERMLDMELGWFDFKGVIDDIGNEIETSLVDALITELLDSF